MKKTGNNIFRTLRVFFGLFMVIVYLGMAYLMFINFFDWNTSLTWFRYVLAVVFMLYGVYRFYRKLQVSNIIATDVMTTKKIN